MAASFEGRAAIVTGSSSGIGKATALLMARRGAAVCVVANRNLEGGRATVEEVESAGGRAVFVEADVSLGADCERVASAALDAFGRVDVLVNNAGITRARPLLEADEAFWDMVLDTNLKSAFMMSRLVVADMLERGAGAIVNVSSVHAEQTVGRHAAYAASKAGMAGMTRALAMEFGPKGLRVNCILPGTIDTSLYPRDNRPVDRAGWAPRTSEHQVPGRLGSPDEIAAAVCFLASDEAAFVNGATLAADGGLLCKLWDRPQ